MIDTATTVRVRPKHVLIRRDDLAIRVHTGPVDTLARGNVLALLPRLPFWPGLSGTGRAVRLRGAATVLDWLLAFQGKGWQERWVAADADADLDWVDQLVASDTRAACTARNEILAGLASVLLCRVVLPSYRFLNHYNSTNLFTRVRQVHNPDLFAKLARAGEGRGIPVRANAEGLKAVTKIVLHTGKDLADLTTEEVLEYRAKDHGDRGAKGVHEAWELLAAVGLVPDKPVREVLRQGQMSAADVVDHYRIRSRPVRDLLIRYLTERRPSLDYGSFRTLGSELVGAFWADIERHHPGVDTINLPSEVVEAWKQRLRVVTRLDGTTRTRKRAGGVLTRVRAFYLDIADLDPVPRTRRVWSAGLVWRLLKQLKRGRAVHSDTGVSPFRIVPAFYPLEDSISKLLPRFPRFLVEKLKLHSTPERFHHSVIETVTHGAHRSQQPRVA